MPFCFIKLQLRCLDCTLADILTSSHETIGMSRPRCHVWWQSLCGSASDPCCVGFYSFPTQLPPENLRSEYLYGCFSNSCWQLREVRVPQKVAGSHEAIRESLFESDSTGRGDMPMDLGSQPVGWAISSELLPGAGPALFWGLKCRE